MKHILTLVLVALSLSALAQTPDVGFGTGDLNGWTGGPNVGTQNGAYGSSGIGVATVNGTQTISCCGSNVWTISPYTGSYMVGMQPGGSANYSAMTTALGLSSSSVTALNSQVSSTGGNVTSTAWIVKDFTFAAGTTFKMAWVYTSTDYVPFNDGSLATLVNKTSATTLGSINGVSAQYILLGATNPGTGNYSTGSYGSTGWQQINYNITTAGDYKVGFGIFNQGDTALSPVLFVNDNLGTVNKNGTLFGAVASNDPTMPSGGGSSTPTVTGTTTTDSVTTSSVNGTPVVTSSVAYGTTATAVDLLNSRGAKTDKSLVVIQTTTVTNTTPATITTTTTTPVTTTTTTTPVTVTSYSDNTTTTTNGTPVVTTSTTNIVTSNSVNGLEIDQTQSNKDYSARIDQLAKLQRANNAANMWLDSRVTDRQKVKNGRFAGDKETTSYVTLENNRSGESDGYSSRGNRFGVGADYRVKYNWIVGAQYNHTNSTLTGENSGGSATKNHFGLYSLYTLDNWLFKNDVGFAHNRYDTNYSIPELGLKNSLTMNGVDNWASARVYTPDVYGVRPFIGGRLEKNRASGATSTGFELTSVTYDPLSSLHYNREIGINIDRPITDKLSVVAEGSRTTLKYTNLMGGMNYRVKDKANVSVKAGQQQWDDVKNNMFEVSGKVLF
jgi:hypothetical protein